MAILSKIVYYDRTYELFKTDSYGLNNATQKDNNGNWGNVKDTAVVFLGDGNIWTHGKLIKCVNDYNLRNYVTLNTPQTITASKTFTVPQSFYGGRLLLRGFRRDLVSACSYLSKVCVPYESEASKLTYLEWYNFLQGTNYDYIPIKLITPVSLQDLTYAGLYISNEDPIYANDTPLLSAVLHNKQKLGFQGIKPVVHRSLPLNPRKGMFYYYHDHLKVKPEKSHSKPWTLNGQPCNEGLYEIISDGPVVLDYINSILDPKVIKRCNNWKAHTDVPTQSKNFVIRDNKILCIAEPIQPVPGISNSLEIYPITDTSSEYKGWIFPNASYELKRRNAKTNIKSWHSQYRKRPRWRKRYTPLTSGLGDRMFRLYGIVRQRFVSAKYHTYLICPVYIQLDSDYRYLCKKI